jgi:Flp pilus assembly protein TadG
MRSRQRGATFLGMAVIIAILGFALYAAIRLTPLYLEYMAVARALEQTAKEESGATSPQTLRNALDRRWTIETIDSIQPKDIEIKNAGSGFTMRAWYRAEAPFISNVSLVADFDKTVRVGGDVGT